MGNGASIEAGGATLSSIAKELEEEYASQAKSGAVEDDIMDQLKQKLEARNPSLYKKVEQLFTDRPMTKTDIHVEMNRRMSDDPFVSADDSLSPMLQMHKTASQSTRHWSRAESTQDLFKVQEACRCYMQRLALRSSHTFCVAVDGSEASHNCLKVGLMLRKGFDRLTVLHFYDPEKTAKLPPNLQPEALKASYSEELASTDLPPSQYSLQFLERSDIPPRTAMCHYINTDFQGMEPMLTECADGSFGYDLGPSFLLVGCIGTRGPDDGPKVLGSVTDLALRSVTIPTIVVKQAPDTSKEQRTYVLCIDGSDRAFNAYSIIQTMARAKDRLVLLYIGGGDGGALTEDVDESEDADESADAAAVDKGELLKSQYEKDMERRGTAHGEFVIVRRELGKSIPGMIIDHCVERDADFVVLSPHPKNRISSVTEAIIRDASFNMIICKH